MAERELRVVRAAELCERTAEQPLWLVEGLWGEGAVGVIGGCPKLGKTWLALEIAVAVASGQPCLGRFAVPRPGRVLFYAAEDAPEQIRERIEHLARARQAEFKTLDVRLILEPVLRLDRTEDLARLRATLAHHQPKLLVLDPYVRLQRVAENDVQQVSAILAALRELSRAFHLAVALVHHTRKNPSEHIGYALRGSGDFNAWGDSNLYLLRRRDHMLLCVEHRFAPAGPPQPLSLVAEPGPPRLELREGGPSVEEDSLVKRVIASLSVDGPRPTERLRRELRVRNQHLSQVLRELERSGQIARAPQGWQRVAER